jgi:23S rRNA (cytosine1962-C5)-methyltransferase
MKMSSLFKSYLWRMLLLKPENFSDYELIDCGNFEKLERFGNCITIRPEPQALWDRKLSVTDWEKRAHLKFLPRSSSSGEWKKIKPHPDRWNVHFKLGD